MHNWTCPGRCRTNVVAILAGISMLATVQTGWADVTATIRQSVHPVLIRKEHNPVARIILQAGEARNLALKQVTLSLSGEAPLQDLSLVELYSTGSREEFTNPQRLASSVPTAGTLKFDLDCPFTAATEVLWISVRVAPTANLTHSIGIRCDAITTTEGHITLDVEPVAHHLGIALRQHREEGVHTYRIPALGTSPKGTLLCVYDVRRREGRDLQEDIDIGLSRSTDGGQTWAPMSIIMDMGTFNGLPQELNGCSDPGLIIDQQTGEIFVFAVWMWDQAGKHQWNGDGSGPGYELGKSAQFLMVRSQDDGLTWSKPENLTRTLKQEPWWLLAPSPQQGIQLPDGTLVMPVQGRDATGVPFATIMTSPDHGRTWQVQQPAYSEGNECQVARLDDGSLMLNMRNDRERFRAVYTTTDLGQTWSPHPTNRNTLIEPNCNGSLYRFDYVENKALRHVLLFANPHTQKGRTHHTIQVSLDEGLTWPESHHRLLDAGPGAGYPSLTRIDDTHVGIVYEGSQSHLVFEKIPIAELLRRP